MTSTAEKALGQERCRVCASRYTLYVQHVYGGRRDGTFPQYFCMDCGSFFHFSGYVEDDERQRLDFEALMAQRANHVSIQGQLVLELITRLPGTRTALEIGSGPGFMLEAFRNFGVEARGFEVNPYCVKFAQEGLGVDLQLGLFDESHGECYDLIVANQVFEHLEKPRVLFELMRDHLQPDGAIAISVPFVERNSWRFLWDAGRPFNPGDKLAPDPFQYNDVHITFFSIEGMKRMGLGLGARTAEYFVSKDTYWNSPGSYHTVIFEF
jgi:SAM-dependent methyltransferase